MSNVHPIELENSYFETCGSFATVVDSTLCGCPWNSKYWADQKVRFGFSVTSYGKTQTNLLDNPTEVDALC